MSTALFALGILISGCASRPAADEYESRVDIPPPTIHHLPGDRSKHKSIFVFLDGTENGPESGTNVWRLYDLIRKNNDPQTTAAYFRGVGSAADPLDTRHRGEVEGLLELALGKGMQERILKGYAFIASYYNPGDDIYIFGFSRGAHQARSLAGLLAYAGVPRLSDDDRKQLVRDKDYLKDIGNDILELTKKKSDEEYLEDWTSWAPGEAPLLAAEIRDEKINGKKGHEMQAVEVTFLGVWDTVPGSSLKDYEYCKEEKGFVKKYFYWLVPGIDKGERYKTDSYPAIHWIAHAVSLDEKRSKFKPLLVCPPIANPKPTTVTEKWFPGAHADVGGGYDDDASNELPGISLNWMIDLLGDRYQFTPVPPFPESAVGLAHWSIGDCPGNKFSDCIDRDRKEGKPHESVEYRKQAGKVRIKMNGDVKSLEYPIKCSSK